MVKLLQEIIPVLKTSLTRFLIFGWFFLCFISSSHAQQLNLNYFISKAQENASNLKENNNLLKIGELQNEMIIAQNKAFKVDVTSEVLVAPYFNSNGKPIEITTNPSTNAYGYDVGVTNGGLYSAQLNVTKNLLNTALTDNLLFQNQIQNDAIALSSEDMLHTVRKNVIDAYIMVYHLQLQENFTQEVRNDLKKRLDVVEIFVKRGVLMESDYLLLKTDIDAKNLELSQLQASLESAKTQLYNLSGIPLETSQELAEPQLHLDNSKAILYYEKKFENDSLQIIADQKVFENKYKPQLSAYGNTGLNAVDTRNIPHNFGLSAGLRLTIPLYDGHQKKYYELQSELKTESLRFYKENNKIQLQNNLKSIQNQITFLEQNRQLIEAQLKQQEQLLEIFKGKLVNGQVSVIDYLNIIQNYKMMGYTQLQMQTNLWLLYNQYNFTNW